MKLTVQQIEEFLNEVSTLFPVPLSEKQNLHALSVKFAEKANICAVVEEDKIIAMVAGYINDTMDNKGYISVVATLPCAQGKGYARKIVTDFLIQSSKKGLDAVHLYTVASNKAAVALYKSIGFEEWKMHGEPRTEALHLIYYFNR